MIQRKLSYQQQRAIYEQGFLHLPGIVPRELVKAALRKIHLSLDTHGLPPELIQRYKLRSYCPELCDTPAIMDLFYRSPLWEIANTAISMGRVVTQDGGQIALRFPATATAETWPHLDGVRVVVDGISNGNPPGVLNSFTALVGVFLSDVTQPDAGNFVVWPGTHHKYQKFFQKHGHQSLFEQVPQIALPPAHQVLARAGDAVICHYQLGHHFANNLSPHIRYAVFFRLAHSKHETQKIECLTDIWREWEGLRDYLQDPRTRLRHARRYYAKAVRYRLRGWGLPVHVNK